MITFKKFLEGEVIPLSSEHTKVDEDLLKLVKEHCSDSMWMVRNGTPIWRGHHNLRALVGDKGVAVVDTSTGERRSENTANWYTLIMDNHPEYKDFPKRSKSFICSTSFKSARSYAGAEDENTMAIIPFNGAKIGWTGLRDLWDTKLNVDGVEESLVGMNYFFYEFRQLGLRDNNWDSFVEFDKKLKTDPVLREFVTTELRGIGVKDKKDVAKWLDGFVDKVRSIYSDLGYKAFTTSSLGNIKSAFSPEEGPATPVEMWVGGKLLCMNVAAFRDLRDEYRKS